MMTRMSGLDANPLPVSATQISVIGKIKVRFHVITGILLELNPQMAPEHSFITKIKRHQVVMVTKNM